MGALCIYSRICMHSGDEYRKSSYCYFCPSPMAWLTQFVCRLIPFILGIAVALRHRCPLYSLSSCRAIVFSSLVRSTRHRMILFRFVLSTKTEMFSLFRMHCSLTYPCRAHTTTRQTLSHRATVPRSLPSSVYNETNNAFNNAQHLLAITLC